jgi:hypothetical protein
MKQVLMVFMVMATLSACKKEGGDSERPVISVTSPMANQQFTAGQSVNIVASVTDNDELHEVYLTVVNKTTNAEVVHFHNHLDLKSYDLNQSFIAAGNTGYRIKVEAEDHTGNHAEIEFDVKGN